MRTYVHACVRAYVRIDQLPVGFIAQLVEHVPAQSHGHGFESRSLKPGIFRSLLRSCLSSTNWDDLSNIALNLVLWLGCQKEYDKEVYQNGKRVFGVWKANPSGPSCSKGG